jgi:hypothetical protein
MQVDLLPHGLPHLLPQGDEPRLAVDGGPGPRLGRLRPQDGVGRFGGDGDQPDGKRQDVGHRRSAFHYVFAPD